ncbi:MAG TPA: HAD family phosphatase [Acidimicrobiales bacterium]|nr:HAD family phosphatase [Acidimicrobiales bacterium]
MIEAILFDFNGVLTTSPFAHMAALGDGAGVDGQVVLDLMLGPYDEDTDHAWHRFERGEITASEYGLDLFQRAQEANVQLDFGSLADLMSRLEIHDVVVDRVRALKADGYRTGLVTNNVKEASTQWREMVPVDELFDVIVDSSEVGMRKPNPAIFRHALDLLGVAPEQAVFLDDAPGNVAGAKAAGLHGILVDAADPVPALAALDTLLTGESSS